MLLRHSFIRVLVFSLLPLIAGCLSPEEKQEIVNDALGVQRGVSEPPLPDLGPGCSVERFRQPAAVVSRKLDVLFLTDTSASLGSERGMVADGIDSFMQALPADTDLRVGVMLAHSHRSSWSGKLFHQTGDPHGRVLSNQKLSMNELRAKLKQNLTKVATDSWSDGGEMGLFSLRQALDPGRLESSRAHGFFREDAALAVVMISDEQDICYDYPAGVKPVPDPQGSESAAKARDCVRTAPGLEKDGVVIQAAYREKITPEGVVRKLKDVQGDRPLLMAAIVYNNPATIPRNGGEDEIGYGWIDAVKLTNGITIDLAGSRYDEGLENLGVLASVKLNLLTDFVLAGQGIDPASVEVRVDGSPVESQFIPEFNQVSVAQPGQAESYVDVIHCRAPEPKPSSPPLPVFGVDAMCTEGAFERKAQLKVGISNDSAEGSVNSTVAGFKALGITPIVYSDAEIAGAKPAQDGVTVLVITRKVIISPVSPAYIDGIRDFIRSGGSVLGEYDGAALFFRSHEGVQASLAGKFASALALLHGNAAGGGILLPVAQSVAHVTDPSHPIMEGVVDPLSASLRTAFAFSGYDAQWLRTHAAFSSAGSSGSIPAGTFPAVMSGRCGRSRVALYAMNHFGAFSNSNVSRMIHNTVQWLVGDR